MPADDWVPLSVRGTEQARKWNQVLFEGVPPHLTSGLYGVILARLGAQRGVAAVVQRRLRLDLVGNDVDGGGTSQALLNLALARPEVLLDLADCLVDEARLAYARTEERASPGDLQDKRDGILGFLQQLERVLDEANSAWRLSVSDAGPWGLERKVDSTTTRAARDAFERGTPAADLLGAAWAATFGRTPDLSAAYRDVVLAVESVATPVLTPRDPSPTLGKAIAHLRDTAGKWTVAGLDDQSQKSSQTLLGMLQTVWQNHQRHVAQGGTPPAPVDAAEAESVLFLGITIVQWFERGYVRRID